MAKVYYLHSCWWEDAYSSCEWISLEEAIKTLPKICYTQGILLEKNKDCHIFTMTFQGQDVGELMVIPSRSIKKLVRHKDSKFILKDMPYGSFKD
tara:strand:+ start:1962 stop:2246 length:285 start_codon:yes stop_codon:yes gene_type:complete